MDSKKIKKEKQQLNDIAENLLVDRELQHKGRNSLDKSLYNSNIITENIEQEINIKKDLIKELRNRRTNSNLQSRNEDSLIKQKLQAAQNYSSKTIDLVENNKVKSIDTDREDFNNKTYNTDFAKLEGINLEKPFENLFSNIERTNFNRETINQFELLILDEYDYMFATAAGLIAGFIDTVYVGTIQKGKDTKGLQKFVDTKVDKLVENYGLKEKIAQLERQKKYAKSENISKIDKSIQEYKSGKRKWDKKSSIRFLEKMHKVSYDSAMSKNVPGMTPDNHHLYSLAHEPSLLGLLVGIHNQITNTSTFMTNTGEVLNIPAENINNDLSGNVVNKIIQATDNWFGHVMSDIAGSSGSKGRGSGLPVPGWASLQKLQFGSIKLKANREDRYSIAEISEWMFKNGYDLRSFTAELVPVAIYETLIRLYWFYKQHIYYRKSLKDSLPIANHRELSRLLLVGASTFTTIDASHATIKGIAKAGGQGIDIATFIMTVNKPGLIDLGFRSLQTVYFEAHHYQHLKKVIDEYILNDYSKVINNNTPFN